MSDTASHLSDEDIGRLSDALYQRTGMLFGHAKRYYVERRLLQRLEATGTASVGEYLAFLRGDPDEGAALVSSFTVNETYFYREQHQLRCLSDDILPDIVRAKRPGDKVRIWSLPCSTGEEAYSIAIWLLDNWPLVDAYNVEIIGSDIDHAALAAAAAGRYGPRALAKLPQDALSAYFEPARRGTRQIIADLQESVSFTAVNLVDAAEMSAQGQFDVIFCRNVLIYFDDSSRARAASLLHGALLPGGYLCLGHTESMSRIDGRFRMRRFTDAIVYQRAQEA